MVHLKSGWSCSLTVPLCASYAATFCHQLRPFWTSMLPDSHTPVLDVWLSSTGLPVEDRLAGTTMDATSSSSWPSARQRAHRRSAPLRRDHSALLLSLPTQSVRALSFHGDQAAVIAFVHDCVKTLELPAMPSAT